MHSIKRLLIYLMAVKTMDAPIIGIDRLSFTHFVSTSFYCIVYPCFNFVW